MTIFDKPCAILPLELLELAKYYNVDLETRKEYHLLSLVKDAATAELQYPWVETSDESGTVFVNQRLGLV